MEIRSVLPKKAILLSSMIVMSTLTVAQEGTNIYRAETTSPDRLEIEPGGNGQNIYGVPVVPEGPSFSDGFQFNYNEDSFLSSSKITITSPWSDCSYYNIAATVLDAVGNAHGTCGSFVTFNTPFIVDNVLPESDNLTISATLHMGGLVRSDGITTVYLGGPSFRIAYDASGVSEWFVTVQGYSFNLPFSGSARVGFDIDYIKTGSDFTISVNGNIVGTGIVTDHTMNSFIVLGKYSGAGISNLIIDHKVIEL